MKIIRALLLILLFILVYFIGYVKDNNYQFNATDPSPSVWIKVSPKKRKIKKDEDLNVIVYYGTSFEYPKDYIYLNESGAYADVFYTKMSIIFGTIEYNTETRCGVKKYYDINYNRTKEYLNKIVENPTFLGYSVEKNYSGIENIVIPSNFFTEEIGYLTFSITIYAVYSDSGEEYFFQGDSYGLAYKIDGDKIIIYENTKNLFK